MGSPRGLGQDFATATKYLFSLDTLITFNYFRIIVHNLHQSLSHAPNILVRLV